MMPKIPRLEHPVRAEAFGVRGLLLRVKLVILEVGPVRPVEQGFDAGLYTDRHQVNTHLPKLKVLYDEERPIGADVLLLDVVLEEEVCGLLADAPCLFSMRAGFLPCPQQALAACSPHRGGYRRLTCIDESGRATCCDAGIDGEDGVCVCAGHSVPYLRTTKVANEPLACNLATFVVMSAKEGSLVESPFVLTTGEGSCREVRAP